MDNVTSAVAHFILLYLESGLQRFQRRRRPREAELYRLPGVYDTQSKNIKRCKYVVYSSKCTS